MTSKRRLEAMDQWLNEMFMHLAKRVTLIENVLGIPAGAAELHYNEQESKRANHMGNAGQTPIDPTLRPGSPLTYIPSVGPTLKDIADKLDRLEKAL